MDEADTIKHIALEWTRVQPSVNRFVRSFIRSRSDAEDVLQDVALRVLESADRYDRARPFIGWALGIARNAVTNHLRRRYRDKHIFDSEAMDRIANAYEQVDERVDDMKDALEQCVGAVAGRNRSLLQLRYCDGLAIKRVAEQLGISVNSATVALHRLRDSLRTCVTARLKGDSHFAVKSAGSRA
jgi:RNA polymerase sigma-70 factor (ECF subfamily)